MDARNCSPASLDRIEMPSPPSLGLRERTSLGMLFEASVPNNAGMNFSVSMVSTGFTNCSKFSMVRRKYVNFDLYPCVKAAYADCG